MKTRISFKKWRKISARADKAVAMFWKIIFNAITATLVMGIFGIIICSKLAGEKEELQETTLFVAKTSFCLIALSGLLLIMLFLNDKKET